ncbi:MAG: molybdopterin-dependent oxidoreductase [Anaerolineaceae bacterium]|nr:molybdopterin-dependent oxidoreductase [Anaerolineaceae bacterium]
MKRHKLLRGALIGGGVGIVLTALFYLGDQLLRLPFLPFYLFDWLARALPGDVVTLGIDSIVNGILLLNIGESTSETAKLIEQLLALLLFVLLWVVIGWVIALISQRTRFSGQQAGLAAALLLVGVLALALNLPTVQQPLSLAWHLILVSLGGWAVGWALAAAREADTAAPDRRHFLLRFGGAVLGLTVGAWGIGWLFGREPVDTGAEEAVDTSGEGMTLADVATTPEELQDRLEPAPGTRPEITPDGEFYRIDINTRPPAIQQSAWQLQVEGLFDNPRPLSLADLMALPAVTQPLTLSCISNRIGGDLISTAEWTGVRLGLVLEELGLQPAAQELYIEAEDGFYESVAMPDMMDPRTLLVYAMNGATLPQEHGFPLRIYIPNRYGMKQPKWITRIEAIEGEGPGYWVDRGWSATAYPHIISIIDTVADGERLADGRIPIGGIAWAGDRGIQQVEVQVDDSEWQTAELRLPPLSTLTWVQWRYDWPAASGEHTFRVRATDGEGSLQVGEESGVRPDGATGYHAVTRSIA